MAKFAKGTKAGRVKSQLEGGAPGLVRIAGVVERTNKYGLFVVNADGRRFGFTLDKVRHYSGQNPAKVGLNIGDPVSLSIRNDRVYAADTTVLAADVFR